LYHFKLRVLVHLPFRTPLNYGIGGMFKFLLGDVKDFHYSIKLWMMQDNQSPLWGPIKATSYGRGFLLPQIGHSWI